MYDNYNTDSGIFLLIIFFIYFFLSFEKQNVEFRF